MGKPHNPRIDLDTGAVVSIDIGHHKIHQSESFVTSSRLVNTSSANYILSTVGQTTTIETHIVFSILSDANTSISLLRAPSWTTTGGTLLTNVNRDETNSTSALINIYQNPTISASGTAVVALDYIPASSKSGSVLTGAPSIPRPEFILKQGIDYQLCISPANTGTIMTTFDFYQLGK